MPIGIFCPYRGDDLRQSFVEETNHICPYRGDGTILIPSRVPDGIFCPYRGDGLRRSFMA